MSPLVLGVQFFRCIPPPTEAGVTARDLADALGLGMRGAQRHLVTFERAGLVRREGGQHGRRPARWWRAIGTPNNADGHLKPKSA